MNETDMSHLWDSAASKGESALPQPESAKHLFHKYTQKHTHTHNLLLITVLSDLIQSYVLPT